MKIAVPSTDKTDVCEHFGRARYFAVYWQTGKDMEFIDNEANFNSQQGVGIQSATSMINAGVEIILSPRIGPKAFDILKAAGIKMFLLTESETTLKKALAAYDSGSLQEMDRAER